MITSELVHDERIRDIINSDYKNDVFVNLMRNITQEAIEKNPFYNEHCNHFISKRQSKHKH